MNYHHMSCHRCLKSNLDYTNTESHQECWRIAEYNDLRRIHPRLGKEVTETKKS